MAHEWYYAKDGRQHGPVSARKLKQMADQGVLHAEDLVWKEGMADWAPARDVKGLISHEHPTTAPMITPVEDSINESFAPRRRPTRSPVGQILLITAAIVMLSSMFTPWWGMTLSAKDDEEGIGLWTRRTAYMKAATNRFGRNFGNGSSNGEADTKSDAGQWATQLADVIARLDSESELERAIESVEGRQASSDEKEKAARKDAISFLKIYKRHQRWWDEHLKTSDKSFAERFKDEAENVDDDKQMTFSLWVWGWSEGLAIMGLVFGVVVTIFSIVFLAVPFMRNWSWIVSIIATIMGILALIFAPIWMFKSPGKDLGLLFEQGLIVGPYLLLCGGVLFFLVGLFDTIFGISFLVRQGR